jgi:hypothetical protein
MYLMRNLYHPPSDDNQTISTHWKALASTDRGEPWAPLWTDPQYRVLFGHDAKRGLQQCARATGLDTGSCYGKKLTGIILPEGELVDVDALRVYETPKGGGE